MKDLDLSERRRRYTCRRAEREVDVQNCPCDEATERRTLAVGGREPYKEQRKVLEEKMGKLNECDMSPCGFVT